MLCNSLLGMNPASGFLLKASALAAAFSISVNISGLSFLGFFSFDQNFAASTGVIRNFFSYPRMFFRMKFEAFFATSL
jgi:hypothetical protein